MLKHVDGDIEFKSLVFAYPSRSDAQIYKSYSLKVAYGQTATLVGTSGSGKSTVISLLERFDDPSTGVVTLDCTDLRELSLLCVREYISLVSQATVHFTVSIAENIAVGKPGATLENVVEAAKEANAVYFISNFSGGFDANVGDRGPQALGGRKQRIVIACAIQRCCYWTRPRARLTTRASAWAQASLDRLLALK